MYFIRFDKFPLLIQNTIQLNIHTQKCVMSNVNAVQYVRCASEDNSSVNDPSVGLGAFTSL